MKRPILSLLTATVLLCAGISEAQPRHKTITTRRGLKVEQTIHAVKAEACDTLVGPDSAQVRLSGYDKPQRSTTESLFVSNLSERRLRRLSLTVTYTDMQGRQLHAARVSLPCDIPAGETRRLYWRAWDRQQSMCYRLSVRSRQSRAAIYNISCSLDSAIFLAARK